MSILYYPLALVIAALLIHSADRAAELTAAASQLMSIEQQTETAWRSLLEQLSLSLYQGGTDRHIQLEVLNHLAADYRQQAWLWALALGLSSLAWLGYLFWYWRRDPQRLTGHLLGVACVCLLVGIFAPMLSLVAYKEVAVLGTVVFKFEVKSVASTLSKLYTHGNLFLGLLILLFSIITPLIKLSLTALALWAPGGPWHDHALGIIRAIGKWSMTDVFVVAVLLAVFALDADEFTDAWTGPGVYFFAAYGILSLLAGHRLLHNPLHQISATTDRHP